MSFTTLSAQQLADLREKAMLQIGLTANDPAFHVDAITVYDDGSVNSSSSTIQVSGDEGTGNRELITVGDTSGTATYDLEDVDTDTLAELVGVLNLADNGEVAQLDYGDGDALSVNLVETAATSMLGFDNRQTLKIVDYARLDQIIEGVYAAIETELDRGLYSKSYGERLWIEGDTRTMRLTQPDVTDFTFLGVDTVEALTIRYSGSDPRATVRITEDAVILASRTGSTTTTTTIDFATYGSTSDIETQIDGTAGWSATLHETMPSAWLLPQPAQDAKSCDVSAYGWETYDALYDVDYVTGHISFQVQPYGYVSSTWNARGFVYAEYTAGFATLPRDLEAVILAMTKSVWDEGQKDSSVIEEKLGDYSYKVSEATRGGAVSQFEPYAQTLSKYRRPSV